MAALVIKPAMVRPTVAPGSSRVTMASRSVAERVPPAQPAATPWEAQPTDKGAEAVQAMPHRVRETQGTASAMMVDSEREAAMTEQKRSAELAASCLQGNTQAWELLVRSQQRRVYGICYRFTGSVSDAEDLTQETFLKVYRHLRSFDPAKASFGVWLTALTRNLLVDNYRRTRVERASDSLDEPFAGEEDGPTRAERLQDSGAGQERHVAGLELCREVQTALARISPELREAVILRDLEDMDYREIAGVLCIPQGTVKSRISRGRAELARLLKGLEGQVM